MIALHPNEKIHLVARKHWINFLGMVVFFVVLTLAPLLLAPYFLTTLGAWAALLASPFLPTLVALFLYLLWVLLLWLVLALEWTDYYLDVWYLTDERLIDIEQKWLFNRDESVLRLNIIQDVTVRANGFWATLLHYGDIRVQTAGEKREFFMAKIANPEQVKAEISRLQDAFVERPQKVEIAAQ